MRSWWIGELGKAGGAEGWFANIQGIIAFFSTTPGLNDLNGWTSYADAGLLWAIQDGFRSANRQGYQEQSQAGKLWSDFFNAAQQGANIPRSTLEGYWGTAELAGTQLGENYAGITRNTPIPESLTGKIITQFIEVGDGYRRKLATGSCAPYCQYSWAYASVDAIQSALQVDLTSPRSPVGVFLGAELARRTAILEDLRLWPK